MGNKHQNELRVSFGLEGFAEDPAEITAVLGLEPTTAWRKGDIHTGLQRIQRKHNFSRWALYSRLPITNMDFEEHVTDVLDQLDAREEAVRAVCLTHTAYMSLFGYFYTDCPGLCLSAKTMGRLAHYHLLLNYDFYNLDVT